LVSADVQTIAVRGSDGRLAILRTGSDRFSAQQWLAADGDERLPNDARLADPFKCDGVGCIVPLADGRILALARAAAAFEDDCRLAAVVVSPREAPPGCAAVVIDRTTVRAHGAVALRYVESRWLVDVTRPAGYARPWARLSAAGRSQAATSQTAGLGTGDAAPHPHDVEPGH
jgi:competence protein ComEC